MQWHKPIRIVLLVLFAGWSTMAFAAAGDKGTTTTTASGAGHTQQAAVTDALANAVAQSRGVQVKQHTRLEETPDRWVGGWWGGVAEGGPINRGYTESISEGPVRSYKILSASYQQDSKTWVVELEAQIEQFNNVGEDRSGLTQLVVYPFRVADAQFATLNGLEPAADVSLRLYAQLVDQFVQSGKYRVLDRQYLPEATVEKMISASSPSAAGESVKLGQQLGADLVLTGTIADYDVGVETQSYYGSTRAQFDARFRIEVRLVEIATGETRAATTVDYRLDDKQIRDSLKALRKTPTDAANAKAAAEMQENIDTLLVMQVANAIIDDQYPVKVLSIDGADGVYLNQGGKRLAVGQSLEVRAPGRNLRDPDTGMTIRADGRAVATVSVTEVHNQYSVAKLVDGDVNAIAEGAVVRRVESAPAETAAKPTAPDRPLTPGSSDAPVKW